MLRFVFLLDEGRIGSFPLFCGHFLLNFTIVTSYLYFECLHRIPVIISDNS